MVPDEDEEVAGHIRVWGLEQPVREVPAFAKPKYTEREKALFKELNKIEGVLAGALGYDYDENYGWNIGEHTAYTLAIEAALALKEKHGDV